jgi:hypothetical protein
VAITQIKNATVTFVNGTGNGFEAAETFEVQGERRDRRFKVWPDQNAGVSKGDVVNVSGLHSDKIEEFTGRDGTLARKIVRSLNKAKVERVGAQPAQGQPDWDSAPSATPTFGGAGDADTPF